MHSAAYSASGALLHYHEKEKVLYTNTTYCICVHECLHACRPRNLLVVVNPYSGCRRAKQVWDAAVLPVFDKARIKYNVVETAGQVGEAAQRGRPQ